MYLLEDRKYTAIICGKLKKRNIKILIFHQDIRSVTGFRGKGKCERAGREFSAGASSLSVCSLRAQSHQSRHGCTMIRVLWPIVVWASAAAGPAGYPGLRCSFEDLCAWRWNSSDWEVSGAGAPPGNYSLAPSVDADDSSSGRSALSIYTQPPAYHECQGHEAFLPSQCQHFPLTETNKLT